MDKKIGIMVFPFLIFCLLLSPVHALFATWNGYVYINGSLASSGTVLTAHINNASTATASTSTGIIQTMPSNQSYYIIDLECASGTNVSFKVWDVWSNVVDQTCTGGWHANGTAYFNLSISTLSDGAACTYAGSCNSGYCVDDYCCDEACDGASEDCNVAGSLGTCTSTAAVTTTARSDGGGGGGGGGGGVAVTTTPVTTAPVTTAPGVTTTKVTTIKPATTTPTRVTTEPKPLIPLGIELSTMQIVGIIIGIVVVLTLVIFLFIRFQAVKMAT